MVRIAKELAPLQPQQTESISKLLEQVLSADGATIHDTARHPSRSTSHTSRTCTCTAAPCAGRCSCARCPPTRRRSAGLA